MSNTPTTAITREGLKIRAAQIILLVTMPLFLGGATRKGVANYYRVYHQQASCEDQIAEQSRKSEVLNDLHIDAAAHNDSLFRVLQKISAGNDKVQLTTK